MADEFVGKSFGFETAGKRRGGEGAAAVCEAGAGGGGTGTVGLPGGEDALTGEAGGGGEGQDVVFVFGDGGHGLFVTSL